MTERRSPSNRGNSHPTPWPLPPRVDKNERSGDNSTGKRKKSRALPPVPEISENIFHRIQSLGLQPEVASSEKYRTTRSADGSENTDSVDNTIPIGDVFNSITYIASDGEAEIESSDSQSFGYTSSVRHIQSDYTTPKKVDFGTLFNGARSDNIISSSDDEAEDENGSPNYSVWRTPPKLEPFVCPDTEEQNEINQVYEELDPELGLDIVQVDSPNNGVEEPIAFTKLTDYKPNGAKKEITKPTSRQSSTQTSDTSANLKSISEQLRLDAYMKRMAEEEEKKKREQELSIAIPIRDSEPQRLRFEEMDLESEEMNFSPVNVPWKDSQVHSESEESAKRPTPAAGLGKSETIDLNMERGVLLSQSSRESHEATRAVSDFQRNGSAASRLPSSHSIKSSKNSRRPITITSKKLLRSMSFRRARSPSNANTANVRAAAVQQSLTIGLEGDESTRMTFVLKGDLSNTVHAVATSCQQHLRVGVFKRHSGDKLRVECRDENGKQLTLSLGFTEQVGLNRRKMTMVEVRPSRKDKGNCSLARLTEFYHKLVTQLDLDGHTVVNTDTRSNTNGSRLR